MTTLEETRLEEARQAGDRIVAQVTQLFQGGKLAPAIDMARAALANGITHPMLLRVRAYGFEQNNQLREATADLQQAIGIAPGHATLHNALGYCLGKLGRWSDAVVEFETAIALSPRFLAAQYGLATALDATGDLSGSEAALKRVLELDPANAAPLSDLAGLEARRGHWQEASRLAEQALAADPRQYQALTTLADVAIATGALDNAQSLIASALADPAFPPIERSTMLTLQGDLAHARGRYDEAFRDYSEANAQRRRLFADQYASAGRETAISFVQWLGEYLDRAPKEAWSAAGRGTAQTEGPKLAGHVFLIGFPRSGTTLLENILSSHPGVVALEEKETFIASTREYFADDKGADRLAAADDAALAPLREDYWRRVAQYGAGALDGKVFVDKRPLGATKLPLIAKLFPDAKILFALRDPRDVVLSCFRRYFQLNPSMYEMLDLRGAARFYAATMTLASVCRAKLGLGWLETRHEALIDDFDGELGRIVDFLGLAWSDEVRDFAQKAKTRTIATPSSVQVIKGLNRDGVGQWRHYRAQLAPVQSTLRPWVEKFGYGSA
ncbi:MAG: sulfotransferase [Alphaproteobacteria bacterium]|nr:sulfotransferase [Alphaproteobacteria bacterium]